MNLRKHALCILTLLCVPLNSAFCATFVARIHSLADCGAALNTHYKIIYRSASLEPYRAYLSNPGPVLDRSWAQPLIREYIRRAQENPFDEGAHAEIEALFRQAIENRQLRVQTLYEAAVDEPLETLVGTTGEFLFAFLLKFDDLRAKLPDLLFQKLLTADRKRHHFWLLRWWLIELLARREKWPLPMSQFLHDTAVLKLNNDASLTQSLADPILAKNLSSEVIENFEFAHDSARRVTAFVASDWVHTWASKQRDTVSSLAQLFTTLANTIVFRSALRNGKDGWQYIPHKGDNGWYFFAGFNNPTCLAIDPDGGVWRSLHPTVGYQETWLASDSSTLKNAMRPLGTIPIQAVFSAFKLPNSPPPPARDLYSVPFLNRVQGMSEPPMPPPQPGAPIYRLP